MEISELLDHGITDSEGIGRLGRLGAQLVLQKGIEDEVAAFLQRVRYERTTEARGSRNGNRPKRVMTAEGELEIEMPQLRDTAEKFISRVIPDTGMAIRTRPLEALIIGAYVRGLSDRDIESLLEEAGLGKLSRTTASRICQEVRDRYRAFRAKSLDKTDLLVLFLDAIYLPTRPAGPRKVCSWPGATPVPENEFCSTSAWVNGSAMRTGWRWDAAWSGEACAPPGCRSSMVRRV